MKSNSNPFILIDFEQIDLNWGHACNMHSKLEDARRIQYFLHMHVHAALARMRICTGLTKPSLLACM